MQQYYISALQTGFSELGSVETKHLNVLRKRSGDIVRLADGNGNYADAVISKIDKNSTVLEIDNIIHVDRLKPLLTLAVSPLKNADRFEWLLEKCTEIGVDTIIPLICDRTESPLRKFDRLERIVVSASMQSKRLYVPKIEHAVNFNDIAKYSDCLNRIIAFCEDDRENINKVIVPKADTIILIGPEGDFTFKEYDFAKSIGFKGVSLGSNILRTETAGIFATTAFKLINL